MKELDFYGFPKSTQEDWIAQVKKDLKGKDFDEALVSKLWGEIEIAPMYFPEIKETDQMAFHKPSDLPGFSPRLWSNLVTVSVEDEAKANAEILELLNSGADGIILQTSGSPNLNQVLKDVMIEYIDIYFHPNGNPKELQDSIEAYLNSQENPKDKLSGGISWSPSSDLVKRGEVKLEFQLAADLIKFYEAYPGFNPLTIDFANYGEAGGTGFQELTFGLGELIELLDRVEGFDIRPRQVFENCGFLLSVGSDHFAEIAKLKAARKLISSLSSLYDFDFENDKIKLIATTSTFSKSLLDPHSNLIRQTYEAMSAILGGANSLWVKPAKGDKSDILSKRMARNVSNILKDESYLDKVMDPAAGSYYLDRLQQNIESNVQKALIELEEQGGWYGLYERGEIQQQIRENRLLAQNSILDQQMIKVGANKYKAGSEDQDSGSFETIEENPLQLSPTRATYLLEKETFKK
ncbi:methylmalonyl-CoA mutase family protein [Algoriphagus namhaensis]|uniref:Methylmalonyl-CoA mutase family protein n=1 Tax=Algoriphagus namhaensis TaxID=915353 RepID=A0ABV8ALP9_9BACT